MYDPSPPPKGQETSSKTSPTRSTPEARNARHTSSVQYMAVVDSRSNAASKTTPWRTNASAASAARAAANGIVQPSYAHRASYARIEKPVQGIRSNRGAPRQIGVRYRVDHAQSARSAMEDPDVGVVGRRVRTQHELRGESGPASKYQVSGAELRAVDIGRRQATRRTCRRVRMCDAAVRPAGDHRQHGGRHEAARRRTSPCPAETGVLTYPPRHVPTIARRDAGRPRSTRSSARRRARRAQLPQS